MEEEVEDDVAAPNTVSHWEQKSSKTIAPEVEEEVEDKRSST